MQDPKDSAEIVEDENDDELESFGENNLMGYDIAVFYNTYNLSTLMKWLDNGKLIIPDFQRAYVWSKRNASEFVDSILRGLPIPSIFFYEDEDGKYIVIDGQQRLKSLEQFIDGNFITDGLDSIFKLTGDVHSDWNRKSYKELDASEKERLADTLINVTVMRQLAPDDGRSSMYLAFQRINTGGKKLSAQEIRMAVSYGSFAKYLNELSRNEFFEKWKFLRSKQDIDRNDYSAIQELILNFFASYFCYPNYPSGTSRSLLDDFFDTNREFDHPKKKSPAKNYISKIQFETVFNSALDDMSCLTDGDFSPASNPAKTFFIAIWVGLSKRKIAGSKAATKEDLKNHIRQWRTNIGEEEFERLYQPRRSSSLKALAERINGSVEYFAKDF